MSRAAGKSRRHRATDELKSAAASRSGTPCPTPTKTSRSGTKCPTLEHQHRKPLAPTQRPSDHSDAQHHAAVFVFHIVAVEHIRLLTGEWQREIDCNAHALAR